MLLVIILQLSEVSFELAHQRVQLEGRLAEAERKVSLIREEAQIKVRVGVVRVCGHQQAWLVMNRGLCNSFWCD